MLLLNHHASQLYKSLGCCTDCQVAFAEEHIWLGTCRDPWGTSERCVPAGAVFLHPGGVTEAFGDRGGDRAAHLATGGGIRRAACQYHRPLPLPQPCTWYVDLMTACMVITVISTLPLVFGFDVLFFCQCLPVSQLLEWRDVMLT